MKTSSIGVYLIKMFESFRSDPYICEGGKWTNGWGHTKGVTKDSKPVTISQGEANLAADLKEFEDAVNSLVKVPLLQCQFDALVSFAFNLGANALAGSTLLKNLNAGDYKGAADQFLRWNKAGGKVLRGLEKRRAAERSMFLGLPIAPL